MARAKNGRFELSSLPTYRSVAEGIIEDATILRVFVTEPVVPWVATRQLSLL